VRVTPLGALALLILVFALERLAPLLWPTLARMLVLPSDARSVAAWLPLASALSLLLGIFASFLLVFGRMRRDFRGQPCLGLGAALVATIGVVLIAMRAPLRLFGEPSTTLAVTCLTLSLLGAAWVQHGGVLTALLGALVAAAPLGTSVLIVSLLRAPERDLAQAFGELGELNRLFLILLALAGILMFSMALLARALLEERELAWSGYEPEWSRASVAQDARGSLQQPDSFFGAAALPARFTGAGLSVGRKLKTLWNSKAGDGAPHGFSVWSYHDRELSDEAELELSLRRSASLSWLAWMLLGLIALGATLWVAFGS